MGRSEGAGEEEAGLGEDAKQRTGSEDERLEVVKRRNTKSREGGGMAARFSSAVGDEGSFSYLYFGLQKRCLDYYQLLNSNY